MMMQVCNKVEPHDIDPVGHEVEVEHGQGPQGYCTPPQDCCHAYEESVGCLDLHRRNSLSSA